MTHLTYTSLGNLLLQLREMNGLSQSEVSKRVGVKSDFISKLERGERNTTPQIIGKLSEVYGVDTNELLNVYHSEVILQQLDSEEDIKPIFDLVESRKKGDSTFQLPSSILYSKECFSLKPFLPTNFATATNAWAVSCVLSQRLEDKALEMT